MLSFMSMTPRRSSTDCVQRITLTAATAIDTTVAPVRLQSEIPLLGMCGSGLLPLRYSHDNADSVVAECVRDSQRHQSPRCWIADCGYCGHHGEEQIAQRNHCNV